MYAERFDDPYLDLVRALYGADRTRRGNGLQGSLPAPSTDAAAAPGGATTQPSGGWGGPASEGLGPAGTDAPAQQ